MATLYPNLTFTADAPTSRVLSEAYRQHFAQRVLEGTLRPLVVPYNFWGQIALIAYLCIPHKDNPVIYAARWPLLAGLTWFQWKTLWQTSSMSAATGYAAGLMAMWILLWSWTWLVFSRPQWDAKRVQRSQVADGAIRQRNPNTGSEKIRSQEVDSEGHTHKKGFKYYWQSYPDHLKERIPWMIDLITNFRGPGWNWVIPTLPLLPPQILAELGDPIPVEAHSNVSRAGYQRFNTRSELLKSRVPKFILGYLVLDALKVIMMNDPYYKLGHTTYALPWYLQSLSPLTLTIYRELLSSGTIIIWLHMLYFLLPLILSALIGPKVLGLRAEPWYYPSGWGSFSTIYHKGLAGLWGSYWHQTFRHCFTAPTTYLIRNGYVRARSTAATLSAIFFAFSISGSLHWAAGVSLYGPNNPSRNGIFFFLQPIGIFIQTVLCMVMKPYIVLLPQKVRLAGNFMFTLTWMLLTGWILADDLALGGIWLSEPIPLSPLRGLGFGEPDAGWWCWEHIGIGWYSGKHWWESGIAV